MPGTDASKYNIIVDQLLRETKQQKQSNGRPNQVSDEP